MNLFAKVIKVSGWSFLLLEISENEQDTKRKKHPLSKYSFKFSVMKVCYLHDGNF